MDGLASLKNSLRKVDGMVTQKETKSNTRFGIVEIVEAIERGTDDRALEILRANGNLSLIPGTKFTTIGGIAKYYGVAVSTVRRYLHKSKLFKGYYPDDIRKAVYSGSLELDGVIDAVTRVLVATHNRE